MTDFAPEAALVLACARVALAERDLARIRDLAGAPIDWQAATQLAIRHGLGPLMHRGLTAAGVETPRAEGAALWARAQWAAKRAREMTDELERIAHALYNAGVRFAPFKGPLLAERMYGDAALRESGDLDVLVPRGDVRAARSALERLGYSLLTPLDENRERLWLASPGQHEMGFTRPDGKFLIELQWQANPGFGVPALDEAWWDRTPTCAWRDLAVHRIPPAEDLAALLVHGTKHAWGSLHWLVDVAEIVRKPDLPLEEAMRIARSCRALRRSALGLELARSLLDAPLSPVLLALVHEADIARIAHQVTPRLLDPVFRPYPIAEALRLQLDLYDDLAQRVACVLESLRPTPGDWDWVSLPRALSWLYWALRPLRLGMKYLLSPPSPQNRAAATPRTPPPQPRSTN